MAGLIVLVTGVTRFIGSALAGRLAEHPAVDRVIGVDAALPEPAARTRMGGADFARVDIRNPLVARVIEAAGVDTVVHASASSTPASSAARSMAKEMNVLGTMQLLAACQRSESVRHLIVRSTGAVYGASSRDPAIFTEDMSARSVPVVRSRPGRDRHRGLCPRFRPPPAGCADRRAPVRRHHRPDPGHPADPLLRPVAVRADGARPGCPAAAGARARRRRSDGTPCGRRLLGHGQRRRRRRHHPRAGDPPGRPGAAAGAVAAPWTACPGRCAPCGWAASRRVRSSCCPPVGCWTPPGCASGSASRRSSARSRRSTISRRRCVRRSHRRRSARPRSGSPARCGRSRWPTSPWSAAGAGGRRRPRRCSRSDPGETGDGDVTDPLRLGRPDWSGSPGRPPGRPGGAEPDDRPCGGRSPAQLRRPVGRSGDGTDSRGEDEAPWVAPRFRAADAPTPAGRVDATARVGADPSSSSRQASAAHAGHPGAAVRTAGRRPAGSAGWPVRWPSSAAG